MNYVHDRRSHVWLKGIMNEFDLTGKVLVVVGGTSGIGRSAVEVFIDCGAKVATMGRKREEIERLQSIFEGSMIARSGDAMSARSIEQLLEMAAEKWGKVDGLYHVAGGSGRNMGDGALHEITEEGWSKTLEWNLSSVFYSNRAAVRQFLKQGGGGTILNMGSVLGKHPSPGYFTTHAYAAAKAALPGWVRSLASYYAGENIRINVLAPGLVQTPMAKRAAESVEIMEFIKKKQPLDGGRTGRASDLDAAAVFFMSDASRFVTGQTLCVDGGWSVSEGW